MRGLKLIVIDKSVHGLSRTPCGVRGLKLRNLPLLPCPSLSHPVWGAWIETLIPEEIELNTMSHPVWGAWIETHILR